MNTKSVLVTGGRSPVALNLVRILHDNGYKVYVAESEKFHLSKKSNAIEESFIVPKPNENHQGFVHSILGICIQHNIRLIIPTCEEIFHIAKAKDTFEKELIQVFCDDIEKLHLLHHKNNFNKFLKENGYIHPVTHQFTSSEALVGFLNDSPSNKKLVLKASYSRFASNVYFVKKGDALNNINISSDNPWILQEFIEGKQYCSYSIAIEGQLVAHTCYPTIYTAGLGANVYFKHVNEPKIEAFVERIVKELNFIGQISFDFMKNAQGDFHPIECNPRATSGLHLFDEVQDFCSVFFKGNNNKRIHPSEEKTYSIGLPMLMYGLTEGYLFRNPRSFINDFKQSQDVVFSRKDKLPYFYQGVFLFVMVARKIRSGKSLTELTTTDIEWDGK